MSGKESTKAGAWTERERIAVLFAVIESMGGKPDWSSVPAPAGRTKVGLKLMYNRLKAEYKGDVAALKGGKPIVDKGAAPAKETPKKRKRKSSIVADGGFQVLGGEATHDKTIDHEDAVDDDEFDDAPARGVKAEPSKSLLKPGDDLGAISQAMQFIKKEPREFAGLDDFDGLDGLGDYDGLEEEDTF